MRLFQESFLGVLLIIIGGLYLIRYYFHLSIPIFRVVVGLILIFIGLSFLLGGYNTQPNKNIIFEERIINPQHPDEYNIIFGSGIVDLSQFVLEDKNQNVKINVIFSSGKIKIDPTVPAVVRVNCAFASANLPDGAHLVFGDYTYRTKAFQPGQAHLEIEASAVFGNLQIIQ